MVEALPSNANELMHGMPGIVWENVYVQDWHRGREQNCSSVTRVLTTHVYGDGKPEYKLSPVDFARTAPRRATTGTSSRACSSATRRR
jgi:hypothetical protein